MSFLSVNPDVVTSAAGDLEAIGLTLSASNAAAAGSTTGMAAMAADDVSVAVQTTLSRYGAQYQRFIAHAAVFHSEFVSLLKGGAAAYLSTEVATVEQTLRADIGHLEQTLSTDAAGLRRDLNAVAATAERTLLGRPSTGTGSGGGNTTSSSGGSTGTTTGSGGGTSSSGGGSTTTGTSSNHVTNTDTGGGTSIS